MTDPRKLPHIDAMRAIAILMVVAVHCGQYVSASAPVARVFAYGQMGVQLFFVASALTLCLSAEARRDESHPLLRFYARRFFRIAPAYYAGIVFYAIWTAWASNHQIGPYPNADQYTAGNMLANALFVHGFYPPANNSIVPGGWSIGAEVAFYVVFPLLFKVMGAMKNRSYALLASIGLSLAAAPLIEATTALRLSNGSFLYFNIITQIPVFVVGMTYYWESQRGRVWKYPVLPSAFFLAAAVVLWEMNQFVLVPFFFALSFVGLAEMLKEAPQHLLTCLRPIGKYSFSMYLAHFAVLNALSFLIDRKWGLQAHIGGDATLLVFYIATAAFTFAIAKAMYVLLERPMIELGARILDRMDSAPSVPSAASRSN